MSYLGAAYFVTWKGESWLSFVPAVFKICDCLGFASTITYLALRMSFYGTIKSFVITQQGGTPEDEKRFVDNLTANTTMTFLCILSTLLACVKVMFFLQMFSSFG